MKNELINKILEKLTAIEKSVKEIELKGEYESLIEKNDFFFFFNTLSTISVALIIGYEFFYTDSDSIFKDMYFWSVLLSKLILYILIINYIYRFYFIRYFYELKFTKIITTFIFSAVVLFCNSKVSSTINDLFGISAQDLPYSLAFTTIFYLVSYVSNVLLFVGTISLIFLTFLCVINSLFDKEATPNQNWWTICVLFIFAIMTFSLQNKEVSETSIRYKAYQLALHMDFNQNYFCQNIKKHYSVAFIGSNQDKVIINLKMTNLSPMKFEDFLTKMPSSVSPNFYSKNNFPVVICKALDV